MLTKRRLGLATAVMAGLLFIFGGWVLAEEAEPVRLLDVTREEDGSSTWHYEVSLPAGVTVRSWTLEVAPEIMDRVVWSSVDFQPIRAEGLRFVINGLDGLVEFRLDGDGEVVVGEVGVFLSGDGSRIRGAVPGPVIAESANDGEDGEQTITIGFGPPGSDPARPAPPIFSVPLPRTGGYVWPWLVAGSSLALGSWLCVRARRR